MIDLDVILLVGAVVLILAILAASILLVSWFGRAVEPGTTQALVAYGLILLAIGLVAVDAWGDGFLSARVPRLTYYGETLALLAFGVSWLTASRVLPVLTRRDERFSPLSDSPPD